MPVMTFDEWWTAIGGEQILNASIVLPLQTSRAVRAFAKTAYEAGARNALGRWAMRDAIATRTDQENL